MNKLRNRGVEDILIAVVGGLKGFPDAINAAFPDTTVQTCIVHLVRQSLNCCGWKDRKAVAKDLKRIYQATDDTEAEKARVPGGHPVLRLPARRAQNHLYDKCDREPEQSDPQNHQNTGQLSNRRCRDKAHLSGRSQL